MKTLCSLLLTCLATAIPCTANATPVAERGDAASKVRQKFIAFNRHDAAAIQNIYAADAVLQSPDYADLRGNVPIADTYRKIFAAIPDARDDIKSFDAVGDRVFVQFILEGHWGGSADKAVHVRIMSVYTVKDAHIVDDATYYDRKQS